MKSNQIKPILLATAGAGLLFFFLRRKANALQNLRVLPIDIAIDSERSSQTNWQNIFYKVKLKFINNERANVDIKAINLQSTINGNFVGNITGNTTILIPSMNSKEISLVASVQSVGILNLILNAIQDGIRFNVQISGWIDTDLGRINVNFSKQVGL